MHVSETERAPYPERPALREIVALRRTLDSVEVELVRAARLNGASWSTLGDDLGLTRQGARKRHLAVDPLAHRARDAPQRQSGLDAYLERLAAGG